jgi:hypothetical protein
MFLGPNWRATGWPYAEGVRHEARQYFLRGRPARVNHRENLLHPIDKNRRVFPGFCLGLAFAYTIQGGVLTLNHWF